MTTRYHVTTAAWTDGDDLLSLDEQINRGLLTEDEARAEWRWGHSFDAATDRQYVSLWSTLDDVEAWLAMLGPDAPAHYTLLACDVDDGSAAYIDRTVEGHPAVLGSIHGDSITIVRRV